MVAKPGLARVRPVLTETAHSGDDERRTAIEQHVGSEPEPFERARAEVLDEHVGTVDQPEQHVAVGGVLQVERDRPLVAVDELPPQAGSVTGIAPRHVAQRIAAVRSLDLDDIGAEVGQVAGAVRSGDHGGEVEHPQAGERRHRRSRHPPCDPPARLGDVVASAGVREADEAVATFEVEIDAGTWRRPRARRATCGTAPSSRRGGGRCRRRRRTRRRPPPCRSVRPQRGRPGGSSGSARTGRHDRRARRRSRTRRCRRTATRRRADVQVLLQPLDRLARSTVARPSSRAAIPSSRSTSRSC